jgi:hypothetical protein
MFVNVLLESLLMRVKLIEMVLVNGLGLGQPEDVERDAIVGAEVTVEQVGLHPEDKKTFITFCHIFICRNQIKFATFRTQ